MIMSLLPKIISNKWIIIGVLFVSLIIGSVVLQKRAYNLGKRDGIDQTVAEYNVEKLKWIDKVSKLQQEYDDTINGILTSYNGQIAEYEQEIDKLKSQDPVIKTRYIHKYVPVETNCTIPQGFVELHNTAAMGKPLSETPNNPGAFSNVTLQDVGSTVAINYYQYNKISEQLKALQKIVIEFQNKQKELTK